MNLKFNLFSPPPQTHALKTRVTLSTLTKKNGKLLSYFELLLNSSIVVVLYKLLAIQT